MRQTDLFEETVVDLFKHGATLELNPERTAFRVRGKNLPEYLQARIVTYKSEILEMLAGDPLGGYGWRGRLALHLAAYDWLEDHMTKLGLRGSPAWEWAFKELTEDTWYGKLNDVWIDGDFEDFRRELKAHIAKGLKVALDPMNHQQGTLVYEG